MGPIAAATMSDDCEKARDCESSTLVGESACDRGRKVICSRSALRLTISLCNLACFTLKLPFLVFVIRAVLEVLRAKREQARVTTFEPPYAPHEGLVHESEWDTTQPPAAGDSSMTAAKIEVICLLLLYVGMLVIHLDISCIYGCSDKCKGYLHLAVYYLLVGLWLFFAAFSYFVQRWPHALSCESPPISCREVR